MTSVTSPRVIWRLLDGKPGHQSQTLGLANALVRLGEARGQPVQVHDIPARRGEHGPWSWLCRRFAPGAGLLAPDWILAAGSGTHWALLCARRAYGGRAVVLMKPSLPLSWFDVVVAPEHDGVTGPNVITTVGALNPMQPGEKVPGSVLVLVGGPSKHFEWDEARVLSAINQVFQQLPNLAVAKVTDSRRTPTSCRDWLAQQATPYVSVSSVSADWLPEQLATVESVWVTADSVSMVYESLSAGCRLHLIQPGEANPNSRVARAILSLPQDGPTCLQEAERVAAGLWSGVPA